MEMVIACSGGKKLQSVWLLPLQFRNHGVWAEIRQQMCSFEMTSSLSSAFKWVKSVTVLPRGTESRAAEMSKLPQGAWGWGWCWATEWGFITKSADLRRDSRPEDCKGVTWVMQTGRICIKRRWVSLTQGSRIKDKEKEGWKLKWEHEKRAKERKLRRDNNERKKEILGEACLSGRVSVGVSQWACLSGCVSVGVSQWTFR